MLLVLECAIVNLSSLHAYPFLEVRSDICDILWRFLLDIMFFLSLAVKSVCLTSSQLYKCMLWQIWMYLKNICMTKYLCFTLHKTYTNLDTYLYYQRVLWNTPFCCLRGCVYELDDWIVTDFRRLKRAWWAIWFLIIKFHRPLKQKSLYPNQDRIALTSLNYKSVCIG